jgi:hypothetical protein
LGHCGLFLGRGFIGGDKTARIRYPAGLRRLARIAKRATSTSGIPGSTRREQLLVDALRRHLGTEALVLGESAGLHAYVRFSDTNVGSRAKHNKVQLREAVRRLAT